MAWETPTHPSEDPTLLPPRPLIGLEPAQQRLLSRNGLLLPLLRGLVVEEAVRDISLEGQEAQQCLSLWCQRHGLKDQAALEEYCRSQALTAEDARWQAELPLRIERYCKEHFSHRGEQRFLQRKSELDRVVYSLIRVKDPGLAQELFLRIAEGEATFADLAAEHSMGHERTSRGIVGPVPLTQAHPRLVELLRTGQSGQLFPPLYVDPWWLVVRLEQLQPASFDAATASAMARELFDQWVTEQVRARLKDLTAPPA